MHFAFFILMIFLARTASAKGNDSEQHKRNDLVVRERISQIFQFFLPLPRDQQEDFLRHTVALYIPVQAHSEECRNHSSHLLQSFLQGDLWALKMIDAGSKLVSGVLDGHLQDLGNYDQCISIQEPAHMFRGQHCVINTVGLLPETVAKKVKRKADTTYPFDVTLSICVPSSCSVEDIAVHVDSTLAPLNASTKYSQVRALGLDSMVMGSHLACSTAEPPSFRTKDYVAMSVLILMFAMVVVGTAFEYKNGPQSVFSVFSLRSNFHGLLDTRTPLSEISCLNGLRVISLTCVIMCHRSVFTFAALPTFRNKTILEDMDSLPLKLLEISSKCVDVFFLMGGIVLGYSFYRERTKGVPFNAFNFILNRYIRLTPLLAVLVMFNSTLAVHTSEGPFWTHATINFEYPCVKYWWTTLLHIGNYYNPDSTCVGQSWYVGCDFQMHLLAPLLLIPMYRRPWVGVMLTAGCFLASLTGATVNAYVKGLYSCYTYSQLTTDRDTDMSSGLDYKGVHFRAPPFLMGILLGIIIFKAKEGKDIFKLSKKRWVLGWCLCGLLFTCYALLTASIVSPHHQWSPWLDPLYSSLSKPVFCAFVSWLVLACAMGHGGILNQFLSWSLFRPLARLTYGAYLVHELVLAQQMFSIRVPVAFTFTDFYYHTCGDVVLSLMMATVTYLLVEAPIARLAAKFLKRKNQSENSVSTQISEWKSQDGNKK